jgi:hypothetical protein
MVWTKSCAAGVFLKSADDLGEGLDADKDFRNCGRNWA